MKEDIEKVITETMDEIEDTYEWDGVLIDWECSISTNGRVVMLHCTVDYPLSDSELILDVIMKATKLSMGKVKKELCSRIDAYIEKGATNYGY
jgi:hypothetical protein